MKKSFSFLAAFLVALGFANAQTDQPGFYPGFTYGDGGKQEQPKEDDQQKDEQLPKKEEQKDDSKQDDKSSEQPKQEQPKKEEPKEERTNEEQTKQHEAGHALAKLQKVNNIEIEFAQLVLDRVQNASVREYAQMMIDHHTKANSELELFVQKLGIQLDEYQPQTPSEHKEQEKVLAIREKLTKLSGSELDRFYINSQIKMHKKVWLMMRAKRSKIKDADCREFLAKQLKVIKEHYVEGKKVRKALKSR